ncbi:hypothetical protein DVH05_006090 [Phytophthora capsici]|nr:hypothetical protein DVH05_006090 [Phytophthora capsici]
MARLAGAPLPTRSAALRPTVDGPAAATSRRALPAVDCRVEARTIPWVARPLETETERETETGTEIETGIEMAAIDHAQGPEMQGAPGRDVTAAIAAPWGHLVALRSV